VLKKEAAAQDLLGDKVVPPVTREAFIEELLASRAKRPGLTSTP
jgi:hypothetical protein